MTDDDDGARYTARARNHTGATGTSEVDGGLRVEVRSPLGARSAGDERATNPEELLALAWVTCLGASARVVAGDTRRITVRAEVSLHDDPTGPGFAFRPVAFVSFEGVDPEDAGRLARAAHERCPVSKLLSGRGSAEVRVEPFTG